MVLCLLVLMTALGACGSSAAPMPTSAPAAAATRPPSAAEPTKAAAAAKPTEAAKAAEPTKAAGSKSSGNTSSLVAASAPDTMAWDRMIIRNVSLSLTVKNVEEAMSSLRGIAKVNGGFIAQSSTQSRDDQQMATVSIQVPTAAFDDTVQQVRALAVKVESEQGTSEDVTEEYVDLESEVKNLQATEASLVKLLDKAEKLEDIVMLQREITGIRGQIERHQGRMKYIERRSEMATLTVSLAPEPVEKKIEEPKKVEEPVWDPTVTADKAWKGSIKLVQGAIDVAITLVVFFWWLIPFLLIGGIWLQRRGLRPAAPPTYGEPTAPAG
jgi:hypothetical protein